MRSLALITNIAGATVASGSVALVTRIAATVVDLTTRGKSNVNKFVALRGFAPAEAARKSGLELAIYETFLYIRQQPNHNNAHLLRIVAALKTNDAEQLKDSALALLKEGYSAAFIPLFYLLPHQQLVTLISSKGFADVIRGNKDSAFLAYKVTEAESWLEQAVKLGSAEAMLVAALTYCYKPIKLLSLLQDVNLKSLLEQQPRYVRNRGELYGNVVQAGPSEKILAALGIRTLVGAYWARGSAFYPLTQIPFSAQEYFANLLDPEIKKSLTLDNVIKSHRNEIEQSRFAMLVSTNLIDNKAKLLLKQSAAQLQTITGISPDNVQVVERYNNFPAFALLPAKLLEMPAFKLKAKEWSVNHREIYKKSFATSIASVVLALYFIAKSLITEYKELGLAGYRFFKNNLITTLSFAIGVASIILEKNIQKDSDLTANEKQIAITNTILVGLMAIVYQAASPVFASLRSMTKRAPIKDFAELKLTTEAPHQEFMDAFRMALKDRKVGG